MRKRKLLFSLLALGLGAFSGGSGAMAQNGWESIYTQTQTTSASWTAINSGNADGLTLGSSGQTTYYYVTGSYNFGSATNYGISGLKIQGTVYLYIPEGIEISCVGGHASGATGAGAGIELAAGTPTNTLYIIGSGTVNAYGGNAANGGDGGPGTDADGDDKNTWTQTGTGGTGGNGGGGAGAGIGTRGGAGGAGYKYEGGAADDAENGTNGTAGTAGGSAGAMGNLYVANGTKVNATGGDAGTSGGAGGERGKGFAYDGLSYNVTVAGGGGGGGGGFGDAASNIGTGGRGGGGGGGGAGGAQDWKSNSTGGVYNVFAYGGKGGQNADGNYAADGTDAPTTGSALKDGWVIVKNGSFNYDTDWHTSSGDCTFGSGGTGGARGTYDTSDGTQNEGNLTYKVTFNPIKTDLSGVTGLTANANNDGTYYTTYSPGSPNIVLPANTEGYNWVLQVYGKSCAPDGTPANTFATATTEYFGGNGDETSRTITPINVYGDLVFQELASMCMLNCSTNSETESTNNDQEIDKFYTYGYNVTVRLQNRTLYRDNHWNTICLPFAMTPGQIAASPLAGATIMKMNETVSGYYADGNVQSSTYTHNYGHAVVLFRFDNVDVNGTGTVLEAGKPYLVKWTEKSEWTTDGDYKDNTSAGGTRHELDFPGVKITATLPGVWTGTGGDGGVTFQGTFSLSADLNATDASGNMNLVLGANDTLYHPSGTINVGACRGYFKIPAAAVSAAPQFVMGFDDDETTVIRTIDITPEGWNNAPAIYNLSGQRLHALQKGVNIVNGKKVIIK